MRTLSERCANGKYVVRRLDSPDLCHSVDFILSARVEDLDNRELEHRRWTDYLEGGVAVKARIRFRATHQFVEDPDMASTLDVWIKLLAEAVRNRQQDSAGTEPEPQGPIRRRRRPS